MIDYTGTLSDRLGSRYGNNGWKGLIQELIGESSSLASLFKEGDSGVWYSPSQISSMFLDVEGTQQVEQEKDVVTRIEDLSGSLVRFIH